MSRLPTAADRFARDQRWLAHQRARTAGRLARTTADAYRQTPQYSTLPASCSLTVFTTVLGQTDTLRPPAIIHPAIRYVCFLDHPQPLPAPYIPVYIDSQQDGAATLSRRLKILADHPLLGTPDVTLWHDAAYQLLSDPYAVLATTLADADVLAMQHPHRTQIEDEAAVIARLGYMTAETLAAQIVTYRADGFPVQSCITSTGYCLRRMTPTVRAFNRRWWDEVAHWGWRDQMSVDYAIWKTGVRLAYIPGHYRDNPYALWYSADGRPAPRRPAHADLRSAVRAAAV